MNKNYFFIFLTALIFSTIELSGKMLSGSLSSLQVTFLRFFIGALIILPFAIIDIKKRNLKLTSKDILFLSVEGILNIPVAMTLLQLSVKYTEASTAAVVFCINPIFTIPFAYFILGEKITKYSIYSAIISLIGILCIFNPLKMSAGVKGMGIALLAAIGFSLFGVLSKKKIKDYGGYVFNAFSFLLGDIFLLAILLVTKQNVIRGISMKNLPVLLFMGIVVTGLGYIILLYTIEKTSAVASSMIFFIKPALAPILAMIFLGENLTLNVILGIVLIIAGAIVGTKKDTANPQILKKAA